MLPSTFSLSSFSPFSGFFTLFFRGVKCICLYVVCDHHHLGLFLQFIGSINLQKSHLQMAMTFVYSLNFGCLIALLADLGWKSSQVLARAEGQ